MPTALHLNLNEYNHMVQTGAFDRVHKRVELFRGQLVEMNPTGPLHDHLVAQLTEWSFDHCDRQKTQVTCQTGLDLIKQTSRPEPDVMWLRRADYRELHPKPSDVQLLIEVAHNSMAYDLEEKRCLYAQAGIVEYWIVDAQSNLVHVFTDPEDGEYKSRRAFGTGQSISPQIAPNALLDLQDLFGTNG